MVASVVLAVVTSRLLYKKGFLKKNQATEQQK